MSFRELDVILRTGYTSSYRSKNDTAGFERLDISCVFKLHSHLKISFFMMSSYNYFIYSLFQAFKIRPRTPSCCDIGQTCIGKDVKMTYSPE